MCIVKPDGSPQLCKTDEIGEIVINSRAGGTMYYGLPGVTKNTFEVCQSLTLRTNGGFERQFIGKHHQNDSKLVTFHQNHLKRFQK